MKKECIKNETKYLLGILLLNSLIKLTLISVLEYYSFTFISKSITIYPLLYKAIIYTVFDIVYYIIIFRRKIIKSAKGIADNLLS